MSSKELVPEIRFEGFEGEWVPTTLGEISGLPEYGMNIAAGPYDGKNIYLRITDIDEETGRLNRSELTSPRADMRKMENFKMIEGDIAFTRTGASVGKSYLYDEKDGDLFYAGFLIRFPINKQIINPGFVYQNTLTENYNKFVKANSQRSGQPGLNSGEYSQFEFLKPTLKEQNEITGLLNNIDNVIVRKKEETNSLLNFKQAMLQKMFPKEGETVPEVRFEGFEHEWKEISLRDVAKVIMGQSPHGKNYTSNPNDYILVQGNADMKNGQVVPRVWTTQVTKTAIPNDIIMSVRAPVGDVGKTKYNVVLGRGVAGIRANNFIYFYLTHLKYSRYWDKLSTGSTFQSINSNHLNELILMIPSEEEQNLVGEYFYKLDQNIHSKQAELKKLKQFKQAMLDKMFI